MHPHVKYNVVDVLERAGVPPFEEALFSLKNDVRIGGVPVRSLAQMVKFPSTGDVVITVGLKEYKITVVELSE